MSHFDFSLQSALKLDELDPLKSFRTRFHIPIHDNKPWVYLCGNSLGLQPKTTQTEINKVLEYWQKYAVEGWFMGENPWLTYHQQLTPSLAKIAGAKSSEVTIMNTLSVNLHLMMVSFYRPKGKKYKILMEGSAFPSDQYAIASQVKFHGFNPDDAIIEIFPREGEKSIQTEDIQSIIELNKDELALILLGGINYLSGQLFDLKHIADSAKYHNVVFGLDLAHVIGNIPLKLHDWGVDFAVWCSYKYLNSGPGGIAGAFIHEKHHSNNELPRFTGWWGYELKERFRMSKEFVPENGAEGWQISTSQLLPLAAHKASLDIFDEAGLDNLRAKSELLTTYLYAVLMHVNEKLGGNYLSIITPSYINQRGCQLSVVFHTNPKQLFNALIAKGIIGDWREPNIIRFSPVPLYNSFEDVYLLGQALLEISDA